MSRHIIETKEKKFVFGWDQPLMSFFLQVHHFDRPEEDNPVVWITKDMYEVENLQRKARSYGLNLTHDMVIELFRDKDDGR